MGDWDGLDASKGPGGLAGYSDEAAWWEKGGACSLLRKIFLAMTPLERVSLLADPAVRKLAVEAMDEDRAQWARRDAEVIPAMMAKVGKAVKKRTMKPYWMRTIESLADGKRGTDRLVGDWVYDPVEQCDGGELVVVGLRYPEKRYALCRAENRSKVYLFLDLRPDIEIEGLTLVGEWPEFGRFMAEVERQLGVGVEGLTHE